MRKARWAAWLLCLLVIANLTGGALGEETLYIRVVGRDDSAAGQAEKLRVRDAALPLCHGDRAAVIAALPRVSRAAQAIAPCRVALRPWRPADDLPAAMTLYITVGPGRGRNWWGVLYDGALRMARAGDDAPESEQVQFVWPVWDWLRSLLGIF